MLNRALVSLVVAGNIKGISAFRGVLAPSRVLYANDLVIFSNATISIVSAIVNLLDLYGLASGQIVNKAQNIMVLGISG